MMVPRESKPFTYSDGDIEDDIARTVTNASDCSVMSPQLANGIKDWPSFYHLSYRRTFLLRPFEHLLAGSKVLELGAGCGALTRYLGETARTVIAVEGSPKRAAITASRCQDLSGVLVINDTIQDLAPPTTFDVVTLIGVLEYARSFGPEAANPEAYVLEKAKSFLKPGGILLLAIENQLGLKYFAGAREDHLGFPFTGVHDLYTNNSPVTFGRKELQSLLRDAGFARIEQAIPLPDYKFPITVLCPAALDGTEPSVNITPLIQNSYRADPQKASDNCFSLEAATSAIVRNGLATELCNSLLFAASPDPDAQAFPEGLCVAHYGTGRAMKYLKATLFIRKQGAIQVQRQYLGSKAPCANKGFNQLEDEVYLDYPLFHDGLVSRINTFGWNVRTIATWAKPWVDFLRANAADDRLPGIFIDATPCNCVLKEDGSLTFFDREWRMGGDDGIPLNGVIFRGLFQSLSWFENVAPPAKRTPVRTVVLVAAIMEQLGISLSPDEMEECLHLQKGFLDEATGAEQSIDVINACKLRIRLMA